MHTLEAINKDYVEIINKIDALQAYFRKINSVSIEKSSRGIQSALNQMKNMVSEIDCKSYDQIMDTIAVVEAYLLCVDAIGGYKKALLGALRLDASSIKGLANNIAEKQAEFDRRKEEFYQKYNYLMNSEEVIQAAMPACIGNVVSTIQKKADSLKEEAREILGKELSVELKRTDGANNTDKLPETMLVARYPLSKVSMQILNDVGVKESYQDLMIDLKKQGNCVLHTAYEDMEKEDVDNFIISYIFRYLDSFPVGTVNVHIFDQNANYLYKRLSNCFQAENAGENTKKAVQIHSDISDLTAFRDVNCEDIFKKTSLEYPDLFSIYDHDRTDAFNLIVLRDGLVDGNAYAPSDILDIIYSLSRPGDTGHKCGLRFLVVDNSVSFDKTLNPNAKHVIGQIVQNCELEIEYKEGKFVADGKHTEVLHVNGNMDEFVQARAQATVELLNTKERNLISIDEISDGGSTELGSIMYIPVGQSGSSVVELPFSCKDENGTVAGQCIGYMAIGQSGSGKSSFFHSLVLSGCIRYSPKDLQFWLLDFKNGGASSKYSKSGLPHIKMIAENNKIDDALCLFQMVLEEMERRNKAFNRNFSDNIIDYNKIAVEKGLEYFPRIIIAIDEVQEIFRDDNASVLQKLISSIATRMRSAGMHFVMVAQNLSDGKSYMLKDAFLPSATGRICFRVAPDIPRDSGFEEEFVQRKQEITELKTGEAYVSYGKDTIKKVKMAYTSPEEMKDKYFDDIKNKYPRFAGMRPLVIGSKKRLSVCTPIQGTEKSFAAEMKELKAKRGTYSAIVAEDTYRMSPLKIEFSQHENSSVLLLGGDKQIASSLCSSFVLSLAKQNVAVHLFNGDRTKVQDEYDAVAHSFMYICQNAASFGGCVTNHRLTDFSEVIRSIYSEYLRRQALYQKAEDEDPEFDPLFLVINDLFAIEAFSNNEMIEGDLLEADSHTEPEEFDIMNVDVDALFEDMESFKPTSSGKIRENVQTIIGTILKNGWRHNMHLILGLKGDPYTWRNTRVVSDTNNIIMFNRTEYVDQMENTYFLKEMLKNISNDGKEETMAIWSNRKAVSKVRPIIYNMSDPDEATMLDSIIKGE
ncbi:FtsK/SpoIIIE domain-containing protein [Butyrivibrio sp. JL13D10]|uniref:FtsK/SpoIIIE domain-containing protein n=1 Tax=Butyrivibrio sp. JL13D10 TaxID=3236815 RepID=UPI0038B4C779